MGSEQSLQELEQSHVVEAVLRSKVDCIQNRYVIWRLQNGSDAIKERIRNAAEIAGLNERLTKNEWECPPKWLNKALCLVPLTQDEMLRRDLQLQPYHVISLREDLLIINEALATLSKRKGGRAIKEDWQTRFCQGVASAAATAGEQFVTNRASASDEDGAPPGLDELI